MKKFYTGVGVSLAIVVVGILMVFVSFPKTTAEMEFNESFPFIERVDYQTYFGEPKVLPLNEHGELVLEFDINENTDEGISVNFSTTTLPAGDTLEDFFYNNSISASAPEKIVYSLEVSGRESIAGSINQRSALYFYEVLYEPGSVLRILISNPSLHQNEVKVEEFRATADSFVSSIVLK